MTNIDRSHLRRADIENLTKYGLRFNETWEVVDYFERLIAGYFNAPFAVATDCCTHAIELSARICNPVSQVEIPRFTYVSVPMIFDKLGIPYKFVDLHWENYYNINPLPIIDAAVAWEPNMYIPGSMMCLSFQFKKQLPIGRGGMILLDHKEHYDRLQKMVRDGRDPKKTQFEDNIDELGYHYYMTPEDAARGIDLFQQIKTADRISTPRGYQHYRDLLEMPYFKNHKNV